MAKYIIKLACILTLIALLFMMIDKNGLLVLQLVDNVYALPIYEGFMYIFAFFVFVELFLYGIIALNNLLKNDVLISNHSFAGDKENI